MSAPARLRMPNPHLGAYYAIIVSAFVSLAIMLGLLEQLGWRPAWIAAGMILLPLGFYATIAGAARSSDSEDFFASGRRVPPVFNGFMLAAITIGGTGYFAFTGLAFFLGFDALCIGLGWTVGLFTATVLFAPYLRKAGAFTLPAFLSHRFRSGSLRVAASALQLVPGALLFAAELEIAARVAALFLPFSSGMAALLLSALAAFISIIGGMRSTTWSGSAGFLASAIGFTVPLVVVSVLFTSLPAPQLTYSEAFAPLNAAEIGTGLQPTDPAQVAAPIAGDAPEPSSKPFLQSFGALSEGDFIALFLAVAIGTASLPSLLVRSGVASSLADQRRSGAWAVFLVAGFAASAPALAAFAKLILFRDVAHLAVYAPPAWLPELSQGGLALLRDVNGDGIIRAPEFFIARDGVVVALPTAAKLPFILTLLAAIGGISIALAAASSHLFTIGGSLAEDIFAVIDRGQTGLSRLRVAQLTMAAIAAATAMFLAFVEFDILRTALTAFSFAAATFFPVLLLAIWWRGCTALGAIVALATGFGVLSIFLLLGTASGFGASGLAVSIGSLIGVVSGLVAGVAGSLFGPKPAIAEDVYFDSLHDPEGEAIYDRAEVAAAPQ